MVLNDSKIWLWGLLVSCPLGNAAPNCPFTNIRKQSVKNKFDFIEHLSPDEIDKLIKHHIECLRERE